MPEKREERTTEGGLDIVGGHDHLAPVVRHLVGEGIRVSLFVEPETEVMEAARGLGAPVVELHTGTYCEAVSRRRRGVDRGTSSRGCGRRPRTARRSASRSMPATASTFDTARIVAAIPQIVELNIGHFLIGEAVFMGLDEAVRAMRAAMDEGRARAFMILGIGSDLCDIRRIERSIERFGERFTAAHLHRGRAPALATGGRRGPHPMPGASPPRRPAPRRSAPACAAACSGATWRS